MIKTLTPIGNSLGLIIDRPILELLHIDRETRLEVTTDGNGLHIRPIRYASREEAIECAKRMMDIHAETLKRLAE